MTVLRWPKRTDGRSVAALAKSLRLRLALRPIEFATPDVRRRRGAPSAVACCGSSTSAFSFAISDSREAQIGSGVGYLGRGLLMTRVQPRFNLGFFSFSRLLGFSYRPLPASICVRRSRATVLTSVELRIFMSLSLSELSWYLPSPRVGLKNREGTAGHYRSAGLTSPPGLLRERLWVRS